MKLLAQDLISFIEQQIQVNLPNLIDSIFRILNLKALS